MRTKKSILNIMFGALSQLVVILIGFWSRRVFVDMLGTEILGINATLTSIISMLCLTELGIGTAIICNLYKPLEEDDREKIIALMQFYKKAYRIIAGIAVVISLCLLPFIDLIVLQESSNVVTKQTLQLVFLLFVGDMASSYLLAYKRSLLFADQKNYVLMIVRTGFTVLTNVSRIIILYATKNFVFYLAASVVFRLLENMFVSILTDKKYPYILTKKKYSLEGIIKNNIVENTKALALHYIGIYLINGTDMMIINKFLGTVVSGMYSNYLLITVMMTELSSHVCNGLTASFGNIIACGEKEKLYTSFRQSLFIVFVLANVICVSFFCVLTDFINIWIGGNNTLPVYVLFIILLNSYIVLTSSIVGSVRSSAGLFKPDRYLHILLSIVNLVISIALVNIIGILGVFLGTFVCLCIKEISVLPWIVYKNIFNKTLWQYQKIFLGYLVFTLIVGAISYYACSFVIIDNLFLTILLKGIISVSICSCSILLIFSRTNEFKSLFVLAKRIVGRKNTEQKETL